MTPDSELLKRYASQQDEATFAELLRRHLDHVYSTALRLVNGDAHLAEDVCQLVFADLARKAGTLADCHALGSWLHTSARFAAAKLVRTEQRRRQREQATLAMHSTIPNAEPNWDQVRPILDETIAELNDTDRDALSLRYFEKKPFNEVGSALGLSENAARMRVERAVDKLRERLAVRGITSTVAVLGTALAGEMVAPAPTWLGAKILAQAPAGAGAGAATAGATGLALFLKLAFAVLAIGSVAAVGVLVQRLKPVEPKQAAVMAVGVGADATPARDAGGQTPVVKSGSTAKTVKRSALELYLVDAQTGLPIPDQTISLRGWQAGSQTLVEQQVELKNGRCVSPFDENYRSSGYWVLTHVDGYADARMRWNKDQGDLIPDSFTVRLIRPVLLHGTVVDPSGNPLANAVVGFGGPVPSSSGPADHGIDRLQTTTDAQGHWELNRIAEDALPYIGGDAAHPLFVEARMSRGDPGALEKLRDGSYVFQLGVAGRVSGRVVNTNGEPVANALVHVGVVSETGSRSVHSDAMGAFEVAGCRPGIQPVTAALPGFAPAVASVNIGVDSAPVTLTLTEGKTLRLRLVDNKGRPVKKANVWYDSINYSQTVPTAPQVDISLRSDTDGRVVWEHAPDQPLHFDFAAPGYLRRNNEIIHPDDSEHVVILASSLFISGTVRDADTGELLPKFQLSIGTLQHSGFDQLTPWWSPIDRFNPVFAGGQFRKSLDEPVIGNTTNLGYLFRFAADGYKPEVTRVYQPDEGAVEMTVNLHKANEVRVTVYKPDGTIAAGAQVGLMAAGADLSVSQGGISSPGGESDPTWTRVADSNGQFTLPDDDSVPSVIVISPDGFANLPAAQLRQTGVARLEAWAQVTGILTRGVQPLANEGLNLMDKNLGQPVVRMDYQAFHVETDSAGKFQFTKVPPGGFQIMRWLPAFTNETGSVSRSGFPIAELTLKAGETRDLSLDADTPAQSRQASVNAPAPPR